MQRLAYVLVRRNAVSFSCDIFYNIIRVVCGLFNVRIELRRFGIASDMSVSRILVR